MSTLVDVRTQSDTTDGNGQVYVTFPDDIDHVVASINDTGTTRIATMAMTWVSGAKVATVKIWKHDGTVLSSHAVEVTVAAWAG